MYFNRVLFLTSLWLQVATQPAFSIDDTKMVLGCETSKKDIFWNVESNQLIMELPLHVHVSIMNSSCIL